VTLCVREDTFVLLGGLGLLAVVWRYPLRWAVVGLALPIAGWGVVTLVVQPAFGRWANSSLDVALAGGETGAFGVFGILVGSSAWIVEALQQQGAGVYLYELLRSVGGLALLGFEGVLALPSIAGSLFVGRVYFGGADPWSRFAVMSACTLIASSVLVVARRAPRFGKNNIRLTSIAALLLLPAIPVVDGIKEMARAQLFASMRGHDSAALNEAIALIPDGASVAAPTYALPVLSNRPKLYMIEYMDMYKDPDVDYFLVDRHVERIADRPDIQLAYAALLDKLSERQLYRPVWQHEDYFLLETISSRP
jgi:hypothetical protein